MLAIPPIYRVFILTVISTTIFPIIEAENEVAKKLLKEFFEIKENLFDTVPLLEKLTKEERSDLCKKFCDNENIYPVQYIDLATLHTGSIQKSDNQLLIPTLICASITNEYYGDDDFALTLIPSETGSQFFILKYMKHESINENQHYVTLVDSRMMPSPKKSLATLREEAVQHFKSNFYLNDTVMSIPYMLESGWVNFCSELSDGYQPPPGLTENKPVKLRTIIHQDHEPVDIPLLPCPLDKNFEEVFYIACMTTEIIFKVYIDSAKNARADHELFWSLH